ncbi:flagellar protein FlaG [Uliginosibacterium sp. 31-16]|uniref:flagellar protein FlaG n=1 Tax=Uliginosibacterium sp. 31-16 TaxID=3068315 RepID=UPI00273D59F8|nr:flagellar protein FlaG [Uliginosibacterium sp. 31-16]MDP5240685.1 flagellar protein FlaG [Uliginosibacterium sp. 31-16]
MAIPSLSASLPAATAAKPAVAQPLVRTARSGEIAETTSVTLSAVADSAVQQPSRQQIDAAMEQMREALPPVARNLQFSLDEETGRSVVKVVDATTHEVIRQMPSEELLNIARTLDKLTGLLLKQKA